jgi:hypothetical protein
MLTFTRAGRDGSLSVTTILSPPVCAGVVPALNPHATAAVIPATANRPQIIEHLICLFMVFQYPNISI